MTFAYIEAHPQKCWCLPHKYVPRFLWYPRIYEAVYHPHHKATPCPELTDSTSEKRNRETNVSNTPALVTLGVKGPSPHKPLEIPVSQINSLEISRRSTDAWPVYWDTQQSWEIIILWAWSQRSVKKVPEIPALSLTAAGCLSSESWGQPIYW